MSLRQYIENEIRQQGPILFSRYMQLCLYGAPDSPPGFYSQEREQFGKGGDFYTSSDVHAVYGRLLARQFDEMWKSLDSPEMIDIIELGPGRGLFAQDVLDWVDKKYPEFAAALRYRLVEVSPRSRHRLEERFSADPRVGVFETAEAAFEKSARNLVVFANEFFDALPVEVLDHRGLVAVGTSNGRFVEEFVAATEGVNEYVRRFAVAPGEGERVDVPLVAQACTMKIADLMRTKRGFGVFVDYGYVQEELFAGRHLGTVTTFRRHAIGDSPYEAPGEQDITVHVNFTALATVARERSLSPLAWLTQAQLLMGIGEQSQFSEAFEGCKLPQEHAKRALQLKHLITPEGMGESFHALILAANVEQSRAAHLSGLKYMRPSNLI